MSDISKINNGKNEYDIKDATARSSIGDLSNLSTTNKSSLVDATNEIKSGLTNVNSNLTSLGLSVVNGKLCQTYSV